MSEQNERPALEPYGRRHDDYKTVMKVIFKLGEIALSVAAIGFIILFLGSAVWVEKEPHEQKHEKIESTLHNLDKASAVQTKEIENIKTGIDDIKDLLKK